MRLGGRVILGGSHAQHLIAGVVSRPGALRRTRAALLPGQQRRGSGYERVSSGAFALLLPDCYGRDGWAFGLINELRKSLISLWGVRESNPRPAD